MTKESIASRSLKDTKSKSTIGEQVARHVEPEVQEGLAERRLEEVVDNVEEMLHRRTKDKVEALAVE